MDQEALLQPHQGAISSTSLHAAFTHAKAVALNFHFTNKTTPNFISMLN